jgi:catechol 2,3-dioxygenase-like lactoylglutathione lyase family enzyme
MRLAHLGLPVRDQQRSLAFYDFGFDLATARASRTEPSHPAEMIS